MQLPVTALYSGLNTLIMLSLALQTVRARLRARVLIGDGGDALLLRTARAHANNVEYVPFGLIILGVLEINGLGPGVLYGLGTLLTLSRLAHAHGLLKTDGTSIGRTIGTIGTWSMLFVGSCIAVWSWQP